MAAFWWYWSRTSLWFMDIVVGPLMAVLYLFGVVAVAVVLIRRRQWVAVAVAVPVLVVVTVFVNSAWVFAPRAWFALHRPLFEMALGTDPGHDYYGRELPWHLRFLSVHGRVSDQSGSRFFPQWIGIPDDAGGYLYNPGRSPAGADLYGMVCRNPMDLGDGWWTCGLRTNGL
ncbi:hypothetical protein ACNQVK_01610 [Mycobacterium sp. 134]|uniref:hypothetical protein n=1 Tax=Mycobacterium sp. 134 TaxID=3400425 RepID=UPI003AAA603F